MGGERLSTLSPRGRVTVLGMRVWTGCAWVIAAAFIVSTLVAIVGAVVFVAGWLLLAAVPIVFVYALAESTFSSVELAHSRSTAFVAATGVFVTSTAVLAAVAVLLFR